MLLGVGASMTSTGVSVRWLRPLGASGLTTPTDVRPRTASDVNTFMAVFLVGLGVRRVRCEQRPWKSV